MPMNNGIVAVSIIVTFRNSGANPPVTPVFNIRADDRDVPPASMRFLCSGFGDANADLLREILRKISQSYPVNPISLCISGTSILPDTQCVAPSAAAPQASSCVVNVNNNYSDGSQIEGSCTFICTTEVGKIDVVPGDKASAAGSKLRFEPTAPGRVLAYRVDVVRKKPNEPAESLFYCNADVSGQGFAKEQEVCFPPRINVNRASRTELERISGIGPATSQAIDEARKRGDLNNIDDLNKVVAGILGASRTDRLELGRQVFFS
jgi:hypothetical protein